MPKSIKQRAKEMEQAWEDAGMPGFMASWAEKNGYPAEVIEYAIEQAYD